MRLPLSAVLLAASLVACSGGGKAAAPTAPPPTPSTSCPPELPASGTWPPEVPDDLPRPPGARIDKVEKTANNVTVVRFTTRNSLREGVIHIVREFPKHGYTLGRGDSEVSEADAPFQRGDVRGLVRLLARGECGTQWLLAISHTGKFSVPFAPGYTPPPTSSPLPFG